MKKILTGRDAGTYLGIAGGILAIAAAVAYLAYGASNMLVILPDRKSTRLNSSH